MTTVERRLRRPADQCLGYGSRLLHARLRGALDVAVRVPAEVVQDDAAAFLRPELATARDDVVPVVWHSVVRQYVDRDERDEADELLAPADVVRASTAADREGSRVVVDGVDVAGCHGHGPPVVRNPVDLAGRRREAAPS